MSRESSALGAYGVLVEEYGAAAFGYAHSGEPTPMDRMHAATGLQEEAIELAEVVSMIWDTGGNVASVGRDRLLGEMGGTMWYVNYAARVYGHTLEDVAARARQYPWENRSATTRQQVTSLLVAARDVAAIIKKHTYHGKPMPTTDDLLRGLYCVWSNVALVGLPYGVSVREAMAYNLEELRARHGGASFDPTVYTEGRK